MQQHNELLYISKWIYMRKLILCKSSMKLLIIIELLQHRHLICIVSKFALFYECFDQVWACNQKCSMLICNEKKISKILRGSCRREFVNVHGLTLFYLFKYKKWMWTCIIGEGNCCMINRHSIKTRGIEGLTYSCNLLIQNRQIFKFYLCATLLHDFASKIIVLN